VYKGQLEAFATNFAAFHERSRAKPLLFLPFKNNHNQGFGIHLLEWVSHYGDLHQYRLSPKPVKFATGEADFHFWNLLVFGGIVNSVRAGVFLAG
jgi:hypothetical protein